MSIYLDHNATTAIDERVLEAMRPYWRAHYGNPSSLHRSGRIARAALDQAREQVAGLVNAHSSQVIFTSGGTEANNFALAGVAGNSPRGRMAVSAVEHSSLLGPARAWAEQGWDLDLIPVDGEGRVEPDTLKATLQPNTRLVSVILANNETGVVQNIAALSGVARAAGAVMHCDAVQAAGKMAVDFVASGVQLMSLSAHKIYGPKGVGALIVDKALDLRPLLLGGGHERGLRAGTENLPGIVGFGAAAQLAGEEWVARRRHLLSLRTRFETRLQAELPELRVAAREAERLPNTVMVAVPGIDGASVLMNLDQAGIAVSSGSACRAGSTEPSHVLVAMGFPAELSRNVIRVSFGMDNTPADVDALIAALQTQSAMVRNSTLTAW
ncbi:MAG: cysteine desulfurase family protein [Pseudomonadota bacterium]